MTRTLESKPCGVCSTKMVFELDGDTICSITTYNGCNGSSKGISALAAGMRIEEFIERCDGIVCERKKTSCPDQMAKILKRYLDVGFD